MRKAMNVKNNNKEKIRFHAIKLLYYNNLLIKQCNKWLPAEEGNKNMKKRIMKRKKFVKL
jgi:hypothetical protein